jgi:hypothetical protein
MRPAVYRLRTARRAGFGEVRALGRAFGRVATRHPTAALREVSSEDGYFAAVVEVRAPGIRSERAATRLFEEAWYDAFGPLSCPYEIEPIAVAGPEPDERGRAWSSTRHTRLHR